MGKGGDMTEDELIDLERRGWEALSSSGRAAVEFYERVLDRDVIMLLPGGMVLEDREAIVRSMAGQPWSSYRLEDLRVLRPATNSAIVFYGVVAQRDDAPAYSALISSTYIHREDGWKLTAHQQTPR
jgi:hypothetical protein